ncbi:MAG: glycosyltransferase, partial [Gemmatimonadetes bacterium]|nr:glycosyltransferase [Gemmatimonadota bacterium]
MMVGFRVVMTLAFYPRGGSAQVVRYLGGALETVGHAVTVCCGSLGPHGASSHAAAFFAGLDVQALDFTEAARWFEQGRDPMAAPVPFHPSFEDRPGVPDRVFASLDDDAYHRQVEVWQSLLERVGLPDLYHIHHLTHVNDAVAALGDRPTVVHLHGTELKMLAEIRLRGGERWEHAADWDQRLVRAGRRADRLVVVSPTDRQLAIDLLGVTPSVIEVVPNGVDVDRFAPVRLTRSERLALWRRWLVDEPLGWDESGQPGTIRYSDNDIDRFLLDPATGELLPVLLFVGRFLDIKRVPLLIRAYATAREALGPYPPPLVIWGGYPG